MLKLTCLAIAIVALIVPQEVNLTKRVEDLEQWKATAESRIQALEGMLKAGSKPAASAPANAAERVDLRQGIDASADAIKEATELVSRGWQYTMPSPKSAQAQWGNTDGRTTWWVGYWRNDKTGRTSSAQPSAKDGYAGDGVGSPSWRRGGSPGAPTQVEWLCSKSGGIKPR